MKLIIFSFIEKGFISFDAANLRKKNDIRKKKYFFYEFLLCLL